MKKLLKRFVPALVLLMLVAAWAAPATLAQTQTPSVFDQPAKTYSLTRGWFQGRETFYYDFGSNSLTTNEAKAVAAVPIFVLITGMDAAGMPQMVQGQRNIIDVVPGEPGYSDLWEVNLVTVPAGYLANTLKSAEDVMKSGYPMAKPGLLVNCPVVPAGSKLAEPFNGSVDTTKGWYKGRDVEYFDFGPNTTATAPIFAFITGMDANGMPQFVQGQANVIDVIPGQPGYSAFWDVNLVKVPADYKANSITSREEVMKSGYEIIHPGIVVNCPVVRTAETRAVGAMPERGGMMGGTNEPQMGGTSAPSMEHPMDASNMPGMPETGGGSDLLLWALVVVGMMFISGLGLRRWVLSSSRV